MGRCIHNSEANTELSTDNVPRGEGVGEVIKGREKERDGLGSMSFIQAVTWVTQVVMCTGDAGKATCSGGV